MSFAPRSNHGSSNNQATGGGSSSGAAGGSRGTRRTDFSGLFGNGGGAAAGNGGHPPPPLAMPHGTAAANGVVGGRVRTRNNSQTQKPMALMRQVQQQQAQAHPPLAPLVVPEFELQFQVDELDSSCSSSDMTAAASQQQQQHTRDNSSSRRNAAGSSFMMHLNNTGYNNSSATTKQSFEILNEDSAEAFEFFAAAASSGIEFDDSSRRSSTRNRGGGPSSGMMTRQDRQRHFSLEDYNEMHCSGNEDSSNESFATAAAGGAGAGQAGMNSTKYSAVDDEGLTQQQQQHHHDMQIDDPEHISFNGSASSPDEEDGGPPPVNAFMFPANNSKFNNCGISSACGMAAAAAAGAAGQNGAADAAADVMFRHVTSGLERQLKAKLTAAVEEGAATASALTSFQFPNNLLQEIASHVIDEAKPEPYGLKGCLIFIYFEGENDCQYLNTLRCDPATIPTFELTLTLRQNQAKSRTPSWIPDIVKRNFSAMPNVMVVSTSYRLVKRRKYRLNEIEELSLQ